MNFKNFCLSLAAALSILFNSIPVAAQSKSAPGENLFDIKLTYKTPDESKIFCRLFHSTKDYRFSQGLVKMPGVENFGEVENKLEAQDKTLFNNVIGDGWRGKIVYETRYNRDFQETVPFYGKDIVHDSFVKIVEVVMNGDPRSGTAKMTVDGKRTTENEMRQKKCCRSGGLGRCGLETVQVIKTQTISETYGSGSIDVMGFINVRNGRYSIEFTVTDIKGITKITNIKTASGMCNPSENKTDSNELSSEIMFPPTVVKAYGEINTENPNTLKGEIQLDADTHVFWEFKRVGSARRSSR